MRRAELRWAVAVLALLPAGCRRSSPYAKLRPHEALQAADDLFREGRLQEAEQVYELALAKATKAELAEERRYYDRLVHICARLDELEKAERYFKAYDIADHPERWKAGAEPAANNIAVARFRRGDHAGAERLLTRALASLSEGDYAGFDENPIRLVIQINLDRTLTAQGHLAEAAQVTGQALTTVDDIARPQDRRYRALPPGLGASVTRYAAFLARQGREAQAARLGQPVRDIEARAGPSSPGSCVTGVLDAPMGCLLEIE